MIDEKIICTLPFWAVLTPAEKSLIVENAVLRTCPNGKQLLCCGESCLGMVFLLSGSLRAFMLSEEGREITLFHLGAGDTCVFSASCVLSQISLETHMVTTADTELLIINPNVFGQLTESNLKVKCFAYELALGRFSTVVHVMQEIIFSRFDRRLAGFLLNIYEQSGKSEIQMTQENIAKEVNTAREVVARMLGQFSADGLVELRRGRIVLKNPEGLKKLL